MAINTAVAQTWRYRVRCLHAECEWHYSRGGYQASQHDRARADFSVAAAAHQRSHRGIMAITGYWETAEE